MTETKLTDFTTEQLKLYWRTLMYAKTFAPASFFNEAEKNDLLLLETQILNASVIIKQRENINSN